MRKPGPAYYLALKSTFVNPFENSALPLDGLPEIESDSFEMMPARYRTMRWSVYGLVVVLAAALVAGPVVWWAVKEEDAVPGIFWILLAAIAMGLCLWAIEEWKGFSIRGVLVRDHDLTFRSGYWVFEELTVPFNRIQHSEISQGPLSRWFQVCTLKLYTAGSSGANLRVPGMDVEQAKRLRAMLDERAGRGA
jgi:membrane protein YdbS with pleckstrin-like domain